MDMRNSGSTATKNQGAHVIAGKIAEIDDGYVLLGFSSAPIRLSDKLADGFQPGQRVTITVLLVDGQFIAQKIELAPREISASLRNSQLRSISLARG